MGGTRDTVEVSWEKLGALLDRMAIKLLDRLSKSGKQDVSSSSNTYTSKQIKNVIRAAIIHVLRWRADSVLNLKSEVEAKAHSIKNIDEFLRYCIEHSGGLIREHPTLQEIRLGKRKGKSGRVSADSVRCIVEYISGELGEHIVLEELLIASSDNDNAPDSVFKNNLAVDGIVEARIRSKGEHSKSAFDSLVQSFRQWPELAKEMQLLDQNTADPVQFLLSKTCLSEMIRGVLYDAVKNCLERDLKISDEVFLAHVNTSLDILGSLCVFELSPDWLSRVGAAIDDIESILEVSVESTFGVEVVRAGRWGGTAKFVDMKEKTFPAGAYAITIDPDADDRGASTNVAVEHILLCVWNIVFDKVVPPASFLSREGEFKLKALGVAIESDRVRRFYHHISHNVSNTSAMAVPGVREVLARLVPQLHVVIWGARNDAGCPVFLGDEAFTLNHVANFLLIPQDVKRKVNHP